MQVGTETQSQPGAKMMNLSRLQVCLNSEDPNVLKLGLKLFSDKVLEDHAINDVEYGAIASVQQLFGEKATIPIQGVLDALLQSSPKLEELFSIWTDIEMSITFDPEVCIQYLRCFIVILRCCGASSISTDIATRIIHTHESSLQKLLENKFEAVASLSHLLIAECIRRLRTVSDEIVSSLFFPRKHDITVQSNKAVHVHQRAIAFFTIVQHAEPKTVLKVLHKNQLLITLIQQTNSHQTIATMLNGIISLLETNVFLRNHADLILTKALFEALANMTLVKTENTENSHFLVEKATMAVGMLTVFARLFCHEEKLTFQVTNIEKLKVNFIESLSPDLSVEHQDMLLVLCTHDVKMTAKCISALRMVDFSSVLAWSYLLKLLHLVSSKGSESIAVQFKQLIPAGLTSKDIESVLSASIPAAQHNKVDRLQTRVHCLQYLQIMAKIAITQCQEQEFVEKCGVTSVKLTKMRLR